MKLENNFTCVLSKIGQGDYLILNKTRLELLVNVMFCIFGISIMVGIPDEQCEAGEFMTPVKS